MLSQFASPPYLQMKPTSIEREIFPVMATENQLYNMVLPGYWMDIGQPKDFLSGTCVSACALVLAAYRPCFCSVLHLASMHKNERKALAEGKNIKGNVLIVRLDPRSSPCPVC